MNEPNTPSHSRVLRWTVLVNDQVQQIGGGDVLLVACRDWRRVLTPSVTRATAGNPNIGIFLDPPYATSGDLYAHTDGHHTVASDVRDWCHTAPTDYRIVLCGYDNEHDDLLDHGWRRTEGRAGGGAGYSTRADNGRRERLWLSPACIGEHQDDLFGEPA